MEGEDRNDFAFLLLENGFDKTVKAKSGIYQPPIKIKFRDIELVKKKRAELKAASLS